MKFQIGIFGLLLGLSVLAAVLSPQELYGEDRIHTVGKGETLYSIARTVGIKADDLMRYNGITDPTRLQAGQRLKIPVPGPAAAPQVQAGASSYRVVRGDTLYSIARKFSVTVGAIQEANSLAQNYVLREGDSLRIPSGNTGGPATTAGGTETPASRETAPSRGGAPAPLPGVTWPVNAREVSYMTGKLSGVVITGTRAESVKSLTRGTVLAASPYRGFGKVVIVQVEGGYLYVYGGCESLSVKEGDRTGPGTELGKLGVDAVSNKPQLYFMVYKSNAPVDPAKAPRA